LNFSVARRRVCASASGLADLVRNSFGFGGLAQEADEPRVVQG
jgi:hypothetical protein